MLKISESCFRAAVCLLPCVVSGLVRFGLKREWLRSASAFVAASFEEIIGNGRVAGGNYVVSETRSLAVFGV